MCVCLAYILSAGLGYSISCTVTRSATVVTFIIGALLLSAFIALGLLGTAAGRSAAELEY